MFNRFFNPTKSNSFFLFGPRGCGKSTLLKETFSESEAIFIDLLDPEIFIKLQAYPYELKKIIAPTLKDKKWIIIDEVQKIPALLDLVHYYIEQHQTNFALSGSSARKLKRGGANLLAGRAFSYKLFPFVYTELKEDFLLQSALQWGTLPRLTKFNNDLDKSSFLKSYIQTYLQEEIIAEQLVRNLSPFSRFLNISGQSNACIVNFTKIAVDINTSPTNVINYFSILEDTLIAYQLESFNQSIRKRQRAAPKFYFFDCGVVRTLNGLVDVPLKSQTYEYGKLFETFIINQIRSYLTYQGKQFRLSYLQTKDGAEIDLIIERANEKTFLLEIKSGSEVRESELNNLRKFSKDLKNSYPICLYDGARKLKIDGIDVLPWKDAFKEIGIY